MHVKIKDIDQELVPVVTPSRPSSPEGLANKRHAIHYVGDHNDRTGKYKRVCIGFRHFLLVFMKNKSEEGSDEAIQQELY